MKRASVACDISGLGKWEPSYCDGMYEYSVPDDILMNAGYLPYAVMRWLGLHSPYGRFSKDWTLSGMNDRPVSFEVIAKVIEENADALIDPSKIFNESECEEMVEGPPKWEIQPGETVSQAER